jgi:hypothetical protein
MIDMSSTFVLIVLFFVLACVVLFYIFTQQSLTDISNRLNKLQPPNPAARSPDVIRHERAYCHDQLVLLEVDISNNPRDVLTIEEIQDIDKARKKIKTCTDELKKTGDWIGLPFDLEWIEMLDRMPKVNALYRKSIEQPPSVEPTANELSSQAAPSAPAERGSRRG